MNGLRFRAGEPAIVACDLHGEGWEGSLVVVVSVGPFWSRGLERWFDYEISNPENETTTLWAMDIELRKIDPRAEPESTVCREEVVA